MVAQVGSGALLINPNSYRDISKKIISILTQKKIKERLIRDGKKQIRIVGKKTLYHSLKKVLTEI